MNYKPIIIVAGEPNSIFFEIFFKVIKKKIKSPIILIGSKKLLLSFPLISDPECTLIKELSCWVEKSMYGKKYMGVERTTFLINPELEIVFSWRKVKVKNHVEEVLAKISDFR